MYREKSLLVLIICLLSIFFVQHTSYAHGNHDVIKMAKTALKNSESYLNRTVNNYKWQLDRIETLIGQWKSNKIDTQACIEAISTVRSSMKAARNDVEITYSMGGTLAVPEVKLSDGTMTGRTINVPLRGYINEYKTYLTVAAAHLPGETYDSLFPKVQQNAGRVDSHSFSIHGGAPNYNLWKIRVMQYDDTLITMHQVKEQKLKNKKMIWGAAAFIILIIGVAVFMRTKRQ